MGLRRKQINGLRIEIDIGVPDSLEEKISMKPNYI